MIYALGAFDGFHLGHARLLRKAAERAAEAGTDWGVMTFDGHPRQLLDRDNFRLLFSQREKDLIAAYLGVPRMEKIAFTHDFAAFSPESFADYIDKKYEVGGLVIGENFRFGRCRAGTPKILAEICAARGWTLDVVPRYTFDGMTVSSTETRRAVALGEMALAAKMLGYPFIISGVVGEGDGRGRKLGFPTANIAVSRGKIYPPEGVYSALVRTGGAWMPCALNIGSNPTFAGEREIRCEAHVIGADENFYGRELFIFITTPVRGEVKFAESDGLVAQMKKDVETCRADTKEYMRRNAETMEKFAAVL
ncbi:riboflavin biosynthesis protein RibF [Cloacibacillus sp. An23]|uniref:riboflavin biosynthesis protein RibF n=1 Tax=Cloacibacillus sp. An23 TaxID=1965591 RepID=UPI000B37CCD1|nr:riboflavin biosynthesis protein RibF [Cloacibacillus sp. An23]OUO93068.1 riboflavin biosynthesis protein RibF [Cloacibacillus sp. An23]